MGRVSLEFIRQAGGYHNVPVAIYRSHLKRPGRLPSVNICDDGRQEVDDDVIELEIA